ncbi:hypothetical protein LO763_17360 [Glycomyces sp. A-F 0318]|nr:hypothetical protein [Glycomyces amatae]MCD0445382.1 hypothetical protein [Glycomyces amatae]
MVVAQHLLQVKTERRWIHYARKHLRHLFPFIPGQSGYQEHETFRRGGLGGVLQRIEAIIDTLEDHNGRTPERGCSPTPPRASSR